MIDILKDMVAFIQKWGSAGLGTKAGQLLVTVNNVRKAANAQLAKVLQPVQDVLERTAKRLDLEHAAQYRATTNVHVPHQFKRPTLDAELAKYEKNRPGYVDELAKKANPSAVEKQYESALARVDATINQALKDGRLKVRQVPPDLSKEYKNFTQNLQVDVIPGGQKLYRVLDPGSFDNSVYWMTEAEFKKLKSKDDWRRHFAVWVGWNKNGEYVTYTVHPEGLVVWRGTAATQDAGKFMLEGGAEQIAVNPAHLKRPHFGKRETTGWGYDDLGEKTDLTGVPVLQNNFRES